MTDLNTIAERLILKGTSPYIAEEIQRIAKADAMLARLKATKGWGHDDARAVQLAAYCARLYDGDETKGDELARITWKEQANVKAGSHLSGLL